MVTMETMTVGKISTSVLVMYFQVLRVCKVSSLPSSGMQEKKLSMIKIPKLFVLDHLHVIILPVCNKFSSK